ncbi:MAG: hypothetical protein CME59_15720 [Halioglobus sp.]|nr:hypothetical protein [Halioglobus sp.]
MAARRRRSRGRRALFPALLCWALSSPAGAGALLQVGPGKPYQTPSHAAQHARDGDTIEIDAGTYHNDFTHWRQDNLTIRGVGGMAHLHGDTLIHNGKGIWVIDGDNTLIENVEFSGARVRSTNGAGIRHQGGDLTLRNTFFHDNEFSILSGVNHQARIAVYDSRFWRQKRSVRWSHGIYIGAAGSFTLVGSHFTGTDQGHQVKSRALQNRILYNRIEDTPRGNSSRLIDLPNCGRSVIVGNDLHQAATSLNYNAIGYGMEGCEGRSARQRQLYVAHNTFVNEALAGTLVSTTGNGTALLANNLLYGRGVFLSGEGSEQGNLRLPLSQRAADGWTPRADSAAIDAATALPPAAPALAPQQMFRPPLGTMPRPADGAADIGSREAPSR